MAYDSLIVWRYVWNLDHSCYMRFRCTIEYAPLSSVWFILYMQLLHHITRLKNEEVSRKKKSFTRFLFQDEHRCQSLCMQTCLTKLCVTPVNTFVTTCDKSDSLFQCSASVRNHKLCLHYISDSLKQEAKKTKCGTSWSSKFYCDSL